MTHLRRTEIKQLLQQVPFISLEALKEKFPDVSSMTLRRDIDFLEKAGELIKVRGGARSMRFITSTLDDPLETRSVENKRAKISIASEAAAFFETGRSTFMDSGSTMTELSALIPHGRHSITTTAPNIAMSLLKNSNIIVNLVGGLINRESLSISGPQAVNYINGINIDIAFIAPSGASVQNGFTCGNYNECELKKVVIEKARRVIMLFDSSKIDKSLPYTFCGISDVDVIITDKKLPEDFENEAQRCGTQIIIADNN